MRTPITLALPTVPSHSIEVPVFPTFDALAAAPIVLFTLTSSQIYTLCNQPDYPPHHAPPSITCQISLTLNTTNPATLYDLYIELQTISTQPSPFNLGLIVPAIPLNQILNTVISKLQRFLLCYQQFQQLLQLFASYGHTPKLSHLYRCAWTIPYERPQNPELLPRIQWHLAGAHASSYIYRPNDSRLTATPYLHPLQVPPFDLGLPSTIQAFSKILLDRNLAPFSC